MWSENFRWFWFVKHLSCAFWPCICLLEKCLLKSFAHLLIGLSFYCWIMTVFLCILDTTPIADKWFANISPHSVNDLFTFLLVSFDPQIVSFSWCLIYSIFLLLLVLLVSDSFKVEKPQRRQGKKEASGSPTNLGLPVCFSQRSQILQPKRPVVWGMLIFYLAHRVVLGHRTEVLKALGEG